MSEPRSIRETLGQITFAIECVFVFVFTLPAALLMYPFTDSPFLYAMGTVWGWAGSATLWFLIYCGCVKANPLEQFGRLLTSPRTLAVLRTVVLVWIGLWIFFHVMPFEGYYYVKYWTTWWFPLLLSVMLVARIGLWTYFITMLVFGLFMGNDRQYQQARQSGWNPFWEKHAPPPNPGGGFVPPASWQYRCPKCDARVEKAVDICWNCAYGSNGNMDAYYRRYGYPTGQYGDSNETDGPTGT